MYIWLMVIEILKIAIFKFRTVVLKVIVLDYLMKHLAYKMLMKWDVNGTAGFPSYISVCASA